MTNPVLLAEKISKTFGAVTACKDVTISLRAGEVHALIGPNGAGKSTLIAQLAGSLKPDSGRVLLNGQDVTNLDVATRSRLGLARTFQVSALAMEDTVLENVMVGVLGASGKPFSLFRSVYSRSDLVSKAMEVLSLLDLSAHAHKITAELSHGQRRQLEMAVALSLNPKVFILDEPMAGLGAEGSIALTQLLSELKVQAPILLVEHDMDAVFTLADRISVLEYGQVVATGTVEEIRNNSVVKEAYLGSME